MKRGKLWLVLLVLSGVLLWFLVRGAGRSQFEAWGEALGPVAFLEVHQRTGNFDGSVQAANVHLIANRQKLLKSLFIDQVVIQTSGLLELLSAPFGATAELPEQFQIQLDGVRGEPLPLADELGQVWMNFKSMVPFDGLACRDTGELLDSDFGGMGYGTGQVRIGIERKVDLGVSNIAISWDNGRFAQLQAELEVESLDLKAWLARRLAFEDIAVRKWRIKLDSGDYLPKRNAYCARLKEQDEAAFVDANLELVRGYLGYRGVTVDDRLWQLWRDFNSKGGALELRADYGNALRLARLDGLSISQAFDLLKIRIKGAEGGEVALRFQDFVLPAMDIQAQLPPGENVEIVTDSSEVTFGDGAANAADSEVATPEPTADNPLAQISSGRSLTARLKSTGGQPAAAPKPKPKPQVARGPRIVEFGQIGSYIGKDLIFVMGNGQRYRARPRGVRGDQVDLQVILRGGQANMTLRRERIRQILVM